MNQPLHAQMQTALEKWGPVTSIAIAELETIFQPYEVRKGSHLAQPGSTLENVFFVSQGLLRFYTIGHNGKEWNKGNSLFTKAKPGLKVMKVTVTLHGGVLKYGRIHSKQTVISHHAPAATPSSPNSHTHS